MASSPTFGIQDHGVTGRRIYFHALNAPAQIGRLLDILEAFQPKALPAGLGRGALSVILSEAFHWHLTSPSRADGPLIVELSFDENESVIFGVSFCSDRDLQADGRFAGMVGKLVSLGCEVMVKSSETRPRREVVAVLHRATALGEIAPPAPIYALIGGEAEAGEAAPREYVELGDLDLQDLSDRLGFSAPSVQGSAIAEILDAAAKPSAGREPSVAERLAEALEKNLGSAGAAALLSAGPAELSDALRKVLSPEEIARVVRDADPQETLRVLKEKLGLEELKQAISQGLSEDEKARVFSRVDPEGAALAIKEGHSLEEIAQIFKDGLSDSEKANLLAGSNPEEAARNLVKAMSEEELARLILASVPEAELARIIRGGMSERELVTIIKGSTDPLAVASGEAVFQTQAAKSSEPKKRLDPALVREACEGRLVREKAKGELAKVLAPDELELIFSGDLSKREIVDIIQNAVPNRTSAKVLADLVMGQETASANASDPKYQQQQRAIRFYQTRVSSLAKQLNEERDRVREILSRGTRGSAAAAKQELAVAPFTEPQSEAMPERVRVLREKIKSLEDQLERLRKEKSESPLVLEKQRQIEAVKKKVEEMESRLSDPAAEEERNFEIHIHRIRERGEELKAQTPDADAKARVDAMIKELLSRQTAMAERHRQMIQQVRAKEIQIRAAATGAEEEARKSRVAAQKAQSEVEQLMRVQRQLQAQLERSRGATIDALENSNGFRNQLDQEKKRATLLTSEIADLKKALVDLKELQKTGASQAPVAMASVSSAAGSEGEERLKQKLDTLMDKLFDKTLRCSQLEKENQALQEELAKIPKPRRP